jgi:hypothetical protein
VQRDVAARLVTTGAGTNVRLDPTTPRAFRIPVAAVLGNNGVGGINVDDDVGAGHPAVHAGYLGMCVCIIVIHVCNFCVCSNFSIYFYNLN